MGKGRQGKEWEAQLGTALKAAGAWYYNTNDFNPASDLAANWRGLGMLIEAKEVHSDTLAFASASPREVRILNAVHNAGGFAAVAICRAYPNKRRAWLCTWCDWLHLQANLGRKSIPLKDGQRPPQLVELGRIVRPHGLGTAFDLQPALRPHLVGLAHRIISENPEAFPNVQTQAPGAQRAEDQLPSLSLRFFDVPAHHHAPAVRGSAAPVRFTKPARQGTLGQNLRAVRANRLLLTFRAHRASAPTL